MSAPYDVLDVCRYIIKYSAKRQEAVSNLKLQKVLYFIQASFLVETGSVCFDDRIEAWDFGPVVPRAYHYFKKYGGLNIPAKEGIYYYADDDIWQTRQIIFEDRIISDKDKKRIEIIVRDLAKYPAYFLVEVTHRQSPWKDAYRRFENNVIENQAIREYFK